MKGRLDEAIAEYREAIRLKKNNAEAHCNLGLSLLQKGQFRQALRHCAAVMTSAPRTRAGAYPSAQWVREAEQLVRLDDQASRLSLGQKFSPRMRRASRLRPVVPIAPQGAYAAAARFYREAFAEEPKLADDLNAQHRYNAACAAALAGCGQGVDADKLDAKERARLRQQALDWLRADLKAYQQVLEKSAGKAGPAIAQRMQHWLKDDDFAGVRGEEALAKLPESERRRMAEIMGHGRRHAGPGPG